MAAIAVTSANDNYTTNADRVCVRTSAEIPYVVVWNRITNDIEIYKGNSSTPSSFTEQDTANNPSASVFGCSSAAIDSTGVIHIVYMSYISDSDDLMYVTYATATDQWGTPATINGDLGVESVTLRNLYTSIAIDSNDIPHVAYTGWEASAGTNGFVTRYENRIGGAWIGTGVEVEGQTDNKDCRFPSIAINASDIPVIAYLNDDDDDLARATGNDNDATSFTLVDLDASAQSASTTSICVDSDGTVYVAGVDSDATVIVYNDTTQRDTGVVGSHPSLVANGTDIYVFYEDTNNDITYSKSVDGGANWSPNGTTILQTGTYNTVSTNYKSSATKLDYVFADETASPDIQWDTLVIGGGVSASVSPSVSSSVSPSVSVSLSPSVSPSSSPSVGWEGYTRGSYETLPTNNNDLETAYIAQDYLDVDDDDTVRVAQIGTGPYLLHEFKDYMGTNTSCTLTWNGQSTLAPSSATVYLQIYNKNSGDWDAVDSEDGVAANTDFNLTGNIADLSDYKQTDTTICCRVYQQVN